MLKLKPQIGNGCSISFLCKTPIFLANQLREYRKDLVWGELGIPVNSTHYTPSTWEYEYIKRVCNSKYRNTTNGITYYYNQVLKASIECYENMLVAGISKKMASMVLPSSVNIEWIWTGNLLAFANIYNKQKYIVEQPIHRIFASELDKILRPIYKEEWAKLVDK